MQRDTMASLTDLPSAKVDFLAMLDADDRQRIAQRLPVVRVTIDPREAYSQIPGRDPQAG